MKNIIFSLIAVAFISSTSTVYAETKSDVCDFAQEIMIQNAKKAGALEFQVENRIIVEPGETMEKLRNALAQTDSIIHDLQKDMAYYCH